LGQHAIYTYAWDLAETGAGPAIDRFLACGLDTVTLAGSYHAGKFLRPHGTGGKVYFPEDGTVYFRHDPGRYGPIRPVANAMLPERDMFAELIADGRMAVNAWLVLLHNTLLGSRHPEAVTRNAFGDPYIYSLCPSHPAARAYAVGLARDVTESYGVAGISMESPGWLPFAHGYHHEFALFRWNAWLEALLGLCFCDHCVRGARADGVDAEGLRARVAADVEAYLGGGIDWPADMAEAFWRADLATDGELQALLRWRAATVTSLVAEIRAAVRKDAAVAVIPSVARPTGGAWYQGTDLAGVAAAAGIVEACFYEPAPERIAADLADVRRRLRGRGVLRGILRPNHPDLASAGAVAEAVRVLRAGGVEEIAFYNWGHLPERSMGWIAAALGGNGP
jgi:hypothetical protein